MSIQRFNAVCLTNSLTVSESPSRPFQTQIYTLLISCPLGMKYQWTLKKIMMINFVLTPGFFTTWSFSMKKIIIIIIIVSCPELFGHLGYGLCWYSMQQRATWS